MRGRYFRLFHFFAMAFKHATTFLFRRDLDGTELFYWSKQQKKHFRSSNSRWISWGEKKKTIPKQTHMKNNAELKSSWWGFKDDDLHFITWNPSESNLVYDLQDSRMIAIDSLFLYLFTFFIRFNKHKRVYLYFFWFLITMRTFLFEWTKKKKLKKVTTELHKTILSTNALEKCLNYIESTLFYIG